MVRLITCDSNHKPVTPQNGSALLLVTSQKWPRMENSCVLFGEVRYSGKLPGSAPPPTQAAASSPSECHKQMSQVQWHTMWASIIVIVFVKPIAAENDWSI
jgi:hypothetical protein